jgi:hypothetical protein
MEQSSITTKTTWKQKVNQSREASSQARTKKETKTNGKRKQMLQVTRLESELQQLRSHAVGTNNNRSDFERYVDREARGETGTRRMYATWKQMLGPNNGKYATLMRTARSSRIGRERITAVPLQGRQFYPR